MTNASTRLRVEMAKLRLTFDELEEMCGVDRSCLHRLTAGKQDPNFADAVAIEAAVGIRVESWPSLRGPMKRLLKMRGAG